MKQLIWRLPTALLGGLVGLYVFPTENVWILAPLVPGLILLATLGTGFWVATTIGFLAGQAYYISHIEWLSLYLGPVPLIALSTLMSIYFAFGTGLTAWIYKKLRFRETKHMMFAPIAASIWTTREFVAMSFPYGGFPWSRLGMTQADSPFANYGWWGGISLISFAISLIGALLALAIITYGKTKKLSKRPLIALAFVVATPMINPGVIFNPPTATANIAAVQGNALAGLFANQAPGTILQNHLDASELIFDSPLSEDLDLIVWPENASDVDPLRSDFSRQKIEEFAQRGGAPFTFGTITVRGEDVYNSTLLWDPTLGPTDFYDKKRPVPFAEFVPDREFWRTLAPDLIDLVPRGYSFGTRDGIFKLENFDAGSLICFEIAIDDIPRGLVRDGAEVILSQTNNADFGYSDETFQQAAIAKLRAIETGRAVVNISTVGKSAIYLPDGKTLAELPWYEPGAMVEQVPLYAGISPAVLIGSYWDLLILLFGLVFVAVRLAKK